MRTGVGTGGGGAAGGDIGARSGLGHGLRQGQQHAPLAHVGGAHRQMEGQAAQRSILQHQGQRAGIVQMGQEMIAADSLEPLDARHLGGQFGQQGIDEIGTQQRVAAGGPAPFQPARRHAAKRLPFDQCRHRLRTQRDGPQQIARPLQHDDQRQFGQQFGQFRQRQRARLHRQRPHGQLVQPVGGAPDGGRGGAGRGGRGGCGQLRRTALPQLDLRTRLQHAAQDARGLGGGVCLGHVTSESGCRCLFKMDRQD